MSLRHYGRVLVIAPHPDDEILGCGGTMARMVDEGLDVHVAIVTSGRPPSYSIESVARVRDEARRAHQFLGISATHMLDFPAAALDGIPTCELNEGLAKLVRDIKPDTLFLPFIGDIHRDHQLTFVAALVAARPRDASAPSRILAYETLSETNWFAAPTTPMFAPDVFIDISIERKLAAFGMFESQVKAFPDERSLITIEALARLRGSTVFLHAAEAFMNVRTIER